MRSSPSSLSLKDFFLFQVVARYEGTVWESDAFLSIRGVSIDSSINEVYFAMPMYHGVENM